MPPVNPTHDTALGKAKKAAGNAQKLAELLGISAAAVSKWGDEVPLTRVLDVERVTGIPRHDLRPDVFGEPAVPKKRRAA